MSIATQRKNTRNMEQAFAEQARFSKECTEFSQFLIHRYIRSSSRSSFRFLQIDYSQF
uniref:Uncharacterized protein n=1 Tax=Arundo donax TaxID=35708 RepID=A0A0A9E5D7_ARUDO